MNTTQTLRQQLEADIQRLNALPKTPKCNFAYCMYFGNFNSVLPGGYLRTGPERYMQMILVEKPTVGSDLIKSQTHAEFHRTIESALEEEGISIEQVKRLNIGPSRELFELVSPAYIRLRIIGYSVYDLTS